MKKIKEPKCKNCWDKGYFTQIVRVHTSADFFADEETDEVKEIKNYCKCAKGKRLKNKGQITKSLKRAYGRKTNTNKYW